MFQELVPVFMTVVNDAASLGKANGPTAAEIYLWVLLPAGKALQKTFLQ
jgi:hypothetical protein